MAALNDLVTPSLTFEEILSDGSTLTNPAADGRRLFLGEDGYLHLRDSAGTISDVAAAGGGTTHAYIGYDTIGASSAAMTQYQHFTKSVTLASAGFLASIGVYLKGNANGAVNGLRVGVWDDITGTPKHLLAGGGLANGVSSYFPETTTGTAGDAGWMHVPIGIYLPAGTYWIGFMQTAVGSFNIYYDGSGSDVHWVAGGDNLTGGTTRYTKTVSSNKYSIRGSLLT